MPSTNKLHLKSFRKKFQNFIILGLENSGKTSIFNYLVNLNAIDLPGKLGKLEPTLSYNNERVLLQKTNKGNKRKSSTSKIINLWDISGSQISIDYFWKSYYEKASAVIYVVDSTNRQLFDKSRAALSDLLSRVEQLPNNSSSSGSPKIPILFLLSKADKINENPISSKTFLKNFKVGEICKNRFVSIQLVSSQSGFGLKNVLGKLDDLVSESDKSDQIRPQSTGVSKIFSIFSSTLKKDKQPARDFTLKPRRQVSFKTETPTFATTPNPDTFFNDISAISDIDIEPLPDVPKSRMYSPCSNLFFLKSSTPIRTNKLNRQIYVKNDILSDVYQLPRLFTNEENNKHTTRTLTSSPARIRSIPKLTNSSTRLKSPLVVDIPEIPAMKTNETTFDTKISGQESFNRTVSTSSNSSGFESILSPRIAFREVSSTVH